GPRPRRPGTVGRSGPGGGVRVRGGEYRPRSGGGRIRYHDRGDEPDHRPVRRAAARAVPTRGGLPAGDGRRGEGPGGLRGGGRGPGRVLRVAVRGADLLHVDHARVGGRDRRRRSLRQPAPPASPGRKAGRGEVVDVTAPPVHGGMLNTRPASPQPTRYT